MNLGCVGSRKTSIILFFQNFRRCRVRIDIEEGVRGDIYQGIPRADDSSDGEIEVFNAETVNKNKKKKPTPKPCTSGGRVGVTTRSMSVQVQTTTL